MEVGSVNRVIANNTFSSHAVRKYLVFVDIVEGVSSTCLSSHKYGLYLPSLPRMPILVIRMVFITVRTL